MTWTPDMSIALGSGATILAVVLALWQINAQARRSEERLVQLLNVSINRLDDKIDGVEKRLDAKMGALDQKVDTLSQHLGEKIDALATRLDQRLDATRELMQKDIQRVEQLHDTRLKTLEKKL